MYKPTVPAVTGPGVLASTGTQMSVFLIAATVLLIAGLLTLRWARMRSREA